MDQKEFHEKLAIIISSIKELNTLNLEEKTFSIRESKMRGVMNKILEIYLAIKVDSDLKSDPVFQHYLDESANLFYGTITADIHMYVNSIERIAGSILEPGEWEKLFWLISAFEAFKELYQGTVFEQYLVDRVEIDEDTEERMELLSQREGPVSKDDIPKGIPSSHWWWWGEPPEESDDE